MSQYEMNLASAATAGQPTNWPHNQLQHPAVHTPIQAYANGQLGLSVPNAASPYAPQTFNQQTTLINGSRPYTDQQKMAIMAAAQQRQQNPIPQLVTSQFGSGMQQNYLDGLDIDRQKLLWPQQQVQQQQPQTPQQISENWFDSKPWNQTIVQASPQAQSIQLPNFSQISNSQPMSVMSFNSPPRQQQQMMEPPRNFIGNIQSNGPNPISSQSQMLPQQQQVYQQTSSPFVNTSQPNGFCSVTPVASVNASPAPSRTSVTPGSGFVSPRPPTRTSRPASSSTPIKEELDIMGVQEGHGSETTGHNEGTMDTQEENEGKSIVRPRLHSMDTQEEHESNSIVRPRLHSILDYDPEPMDETPKQNEEQDSSSHGSNHGSNHGNLNEDEASRLLLSFSQSLPTMSEHNQLAALRIEERIRLESSQSSSSQDPENGPTQADPSNIPSSTPNTNHVQEIVTSSPSTSNTPTTQTTTNRGFFRAPGLGPLEISDTLQNSIDKKEVFTCPVCGFSCGSKFHFQSHMNTHGDHRCSICNYTCRTEGRLKKHQREGHSLEQLVAAGVDISFSQQQQQQQNPNTTENSIPTTPSEINVTSPSADLSSTMASLIDAANRAAAARREATVADIVESVASQTHVSSSPQLSQSLLQIAPSPSSVSNSVITSSSIQPSPLDQIRALNSSLLPSGGMTLGGNSSLATALGLFSLPNGGADNMSDIDMNPDSVNPSRDGPRRSSGGKPKSYKCKQCNHVSMSKEESWQHARLHIPPEKQLVCKQCDFVTEYKHHLEYHLRNHYGSKPFKCSKCAYACVNKSMLNSHMKSHSNAYQFQCMDCNYQSKYCHSLKMHLRKYNHRRKPGGAPMTDDNEDELMMLDEQTQQALQQQLNEQFNLQPGGPVMGSDISKPIATTLSSMLLQPIVTSSSLQYAFMRQQQHQVEQMNAIIRAANPLACNLCDFRTSTNDELGRHIVDHIAANQEAAALQQPSLANLYQNLIQSIPQLLPGTPPQLPAPQPRPPSTTASATATITVGPTINGSNMPPMGFQGASLAQLQQDALLRLQQSQEIQPRSGAESLKMDAQGTEIEDEHHHRFTPDDGSGHDESVNSSGEGSSTSPGGSKGSRTSSYSGDIHGGSKKRKGKALKLEQISQRLQDKRSPDGVQRAETSATDDTGVTTTTSSSSILPSMSVENVTASNLDQVVTEVRLLQERCRQLLRHTCDHCEISFKDLPLYKIHSGYHSIENPFKCNHCGFLANDSLGFNLHLLQERH